MGLAKYSSRFCCVIYLGIDDIEILPSKPSQTMPEEIKKLIYRLKMKNSPPRRPNALDIAIIFSNASH